MEFSGVGHRGPVPVLFLLAVVLWVPFLVIGVAWVALVVTVMEQLERAPTRQRTKAPGRVVVLYDGQCTFCTGQVERLVRLAGSGRIEVRDFQAPGVLAEFPGVTWEQCMKAMQLVTARGVVFSGFEAAVRAVATRRPLGLVAYGYYLPIVRQICDAVYAIVAANRYRIAGKQVAAGACDGGTCALHFKPPSA